MAATGTEIETAYRKLKSYVYYDKTDLRLRERLAAQTRYSAWQASRCRASVLPFTAASHRVAALRMPGL